MWLIRFCGQNAGRSLKFETPPGYFAKILQDLQEVLPSGLLFHQNSGREAYIFNVGGCSARSKDEISKLGQNFVLL